MFANGHLFNGYFEKIIGLSLHFIHCTIIVRKGIYFVKLFFKTIYFTYTISINI